jgi:uncharacterized protein YlaI
VAYRTDERQILGLNKRKCNKTKFKNSGIYPLTCPDCNCKYNRQTRDSLKSGFKNTFYPLEIIPLKFTQH